MAPLFCHLHQLTSLLMKRIFSHQHRRGWQSMPPPATEAMRTRLRAEYRQRKVIPLCRCFISPPHPNLYQLTSPPTKRIVLLSTGLRVCFNVPCPAALADTARRERIIMATGERRSRQKKDVFQKVTSTHLPAFETNCTAQHRLEGLLQCSLPGGPCGHAQAREDNNRNR